MKTSMTGSRVVLPRAAGAFWSPLGRQLVRDILRALPASASSARAHVLLVDPVRHMAAWSGSAHVLADFEPAVTEARCAEEKPLGESSGEETGRRIPTLRPLLDALAAGEASRCFPMRRDAALMGLFVLVPADGQDLGRRALRDVRRHLRLAETTLRVSQRSLEEQRELEGYRALSHLLDSGAPRDRHALARALGKSMAAVTRARNCLILARDNASAPLVVIGSRGYSLGKSGGMTVWPQDPPWSDVLESEQPFEMDTAVLDASWQALLGEGRVLVAPVHWKGWLRSLLIFPSDIKRAAGAHLLDPAGLASVGAHAGLLWQNAELIQRLRRDEEVLQGLMQRAMQVQEEERRRIASDIHDGVTQRIVSIWYRLLNLEKLMAIDMGEAHAELNVIKEQIDAAMKEARAAIYNLRPSTLDDLGLVPSIRSLIHEFEKETGAATLFQVRGERRLPGYFEVGLYRIVQEALRNIKKHADASSVRVSLHLGEESVRLSISDDGKGFQRRRRGGGGTLKSFGLESMEERAQMLGAELFVRSHPGEGTTLRVGLRVPLEVGS